MTNLPVVFRAALPADDARLRALLESVGLPTSDVAAGERQAYVLAFEGERLVGSVGVELAGPDALFRSLAVVPDQRGRGLASALHDEALAVARSRGVANAYLLTTTAEEFAARRGFERIDRRDVPAAISALAQFRGICSATATCMRRRIGG